MVTYRWHMEAIHSTQVWLGSNKYSTMPVESFHCSVVSKRGSNYTAVMHHDSDKEVINVVSKKHWLV